MEDLFDFDSENCGAGGKMIQERLPKKQSLGSIVRKRLSDITNSQQRLKSPNQDEKPRPVSAMTKDYIEQLHKENMALMRILAERNKIVELSGIELTKLRINLQKVQQQNWHLAQANSQMVAELNLGKERLKAMQHELGCKVSLLTAKNLKLQEKAKEKPGSEEVTEKCEVTGESLQANCNNKTCNPNRRHQSRSQSLVPSTVTQQVAVKEKADNKRIGLRRQSARFISEQPEPTKEEVDNKRLCSRRQSARFKSEQPEPTEDLFEIEDTKFPIHSMLEDSMHEDKPTSVDSSTTKEGKEGKIALSHVTQELRRSSIGRPMRKATEKVQSYKEVPINVKMRRPE